MGLLMLSTVLDYLYGFGVASSNKNRTRFFLYLSIINNLGILGVFKYYNFFAIEFQKVLEFIGLHTNPKLIQVALPIGISFYIFHGLSYVFDIYRGNQKPVKRVIDYAVFVSFFPLLVAGPIERASHLLPQVQKPRLFNYKQAVEGCRLILWGMFKKVVIADSLGSIVDEIFINYQEKSGITLMVGAIAFSFQIYSDFSGYSDIALGTAKLFGFELLSNFKFPYFSRDLAEFWRRWHISLTSWFRDYLYIPLGGSKHGKFKAIRNTFIIFLVSGFWHGASWNFIAWGIIHACGFLPLLLLKRNRMHVNNVVAEDRKLPNIKELGQMLSTFTFVTIAWIFFRAGDITLSLHYINNIFTSICNDPYQFLTVPDGKMAFAYIIPLVLADWLMRRDERLVLQIKNQVLRMLTYIVIAVIVILEMLIYLKGKPTSFIYFEF